MASHSPWSLNLMKRQFPSKAPSPLYDMASAHSTVIRHTADNIIRSQHVVKRHLSGGGIAGAVVGSVVGLILVALCLYPVIVRQRRRNRHSSGLPGDAESALGPVTQAGGLHTQDPRRLSSTDSFKLEGRHADSGLDNRRSKEERPNFGRGTDSTAPNQNRELDLTQPHDPTLYDGAEQPYSPQEAPFFQPNSYEIDPAIMNGLSADYYSPSIPSEAFGVYPDQEETEMPSRTLSRTDSFKQSFMQMMHRKSKRERTFSNASNNIKGAPSSTSAPRADHVEPPPQILTSEVTAASPLPATESSIPQVGNTTDITPNSPKPPESVTTPSHTSPIQHRFQQSPSPPAQPAPGTVNPMDIMPASTRSEQCYRTEQALNGYEESSQAQSSPLQPTIEYEPIVTSPSPAAGTPFPPHAVSDNELASEKPWGAEAVAPSDGDVVMGDEISHGYLSPLPVGSERRPSVASDVSSWVHGPASTDMSSQNTPATQLDSPSPGSTRASELRHSESPPTHISVPSPRDGMYYCDEPGCGQSFDQPHKLKHHQRYHSKNHKCQYPGCGMGFGTKTHLQRHINDRHEKKKKFHCAVQGCDYSRSGGKAFPRKDNWKRHMTKIHNLEQKDLPEPIEIDVGAL